MNILPLSPLEIGLIIAFVVIVAAGIAVFLVLRKRRTERLRSQFGGTEYDRALAGDGAGEKLKHVLMNVRSESTRSISVPSGQATGPGLPSRGSKSRGGSLTVPEERSRKPTNLCAT